MTTLSVCFTNFGPYHIARLRALADLLARAGDRLIAYELADQEVRYPWSRDEGTQPFEWVILFPGRSMESISGDDCRRAMLRALDRDRPDALGIVGYARPESRAALRWALRSGRPSILMSESQEIDHPRVWWKEAVKRQIVRKFTSALVGGPRHRDYLIRLGMSRSRIAFGYNAIDNEAFAGRARAARAAGRDPQLPQKPYFLAVNRFVPEKNLVSLVRAFAEYRSMTPQGEGWDLVLCGDGPAGPEVDQAIRGHGVSGAVHRPGFLQVEQQAPWLAFASAYVHPSRMEPWGLVVNEAAACGLPLLVSERAGCVETLVPRNGSPTGRRIDPDCDEDMAAGLAWMAGLPEPERAAMGRRAAEVVGEWGPERFARGTLEALAIARNSSPGATYHRQLLRRGQGTRA